MRIFSKTVGEYVRFAAGIVVLAVLVGVARLELSMAGAPVSVVKLVSVNAVALLGVVDPTHPTGEANPQRCPFIAAPTGRGRASCPRCL